MKKKIIPFIIVASLLALSTLVTTPHPAAPQALATAFPIVTLSTPGQVYNNPSPVGGFKIRADNVTILNCTIYASTDFSFEVRANGLTVNGCNVYNNRTEGSIFDFVLPNGQAVTNTTIRNVYADGDVGWAVTGRWDGLYVFDSTFLNVGKKSSSGKHVFYFKDAKNGVFENITVRNVWNSCIKIVGQVSNIYIKNMTCENIGESKDYGSAIMIGEGGDNARTTYTSNLVFENFRAINTFDHDVEVYDTRVNIQATINGVFYSTLRTMDLPPVVIGTPPTSTTTKTATPSHTATKTATRTPTVTMTATPTPVPTFCETAESEHFRFEGCSK